MDKSWYEENIEEEVRDLVLLLRNNGFNTECSCGHDMYIQCQYFTDGEIQRLDNFLFNNGYTDYTVTVKVRRVEGHLHSTLQIEFV